MVKINEMLSKYNIKLFEFPDTMWERSGFYYPDLRIIYVNQNLSQIEKEKLFYMSWAISNTILSNIKDCY